MPAWLQRPLNFVGSYTSLKAYQNCPHAMFRRYIKRDQPYTETPEIKWGNEVHDAFEKRVASGRPLPLNMQQWEKFAAGFDGYNARTELKLAVARSGEAVEYNAKDAWVRVKVDLAIVGEGRAYINDWKTGNSRYEDPFELEIAALMLQARWPDLRTLCGHYTWLKDDRVGQMYDLSGTERTWAEVCRLMGEIEGRGTVADAFEKKPTGLCGWCSVRDCEHWKPRS